jgi:N-acetylmuramic acid 6-phosphate etherase
MVRLGKVHGHHMIDVQVTNAKLRRRAVGIVRDLVGTDEQEAARLLDAAGAEVKTAALMGIAGLGATEARIALASSGGVLRRAIRAATGVPRPGASATGLPTHGPGGSVGTHQTG